MLCCYNVHLSQNRGNFLRFPEHHWVGSSKIYASYPTTVFQLSVYMFCFYKYGAPLSRRLGPAKQLCYYFGINISGEEPFLITFPNNHCKMFFRLLPVPSVGTQVTSIQSFCCIGYEAVAESVNELTMGSTVLLFNVHKFF